MPKHRAISAVVVLSALLLGADEPSYKIKLHRDLQVGGDYHIEMSARETRTVAQIWPGAAKPEVQARAFELTGRMHVETVNAIGNTRHFQVTVEKFTAADGTVLAAPGAILDVTRGEKETTCTAKDGLLKAQAREAVQLLFYPYPEPDVSDDEYYGSAQPRRAGESWDAKTAAIQKHWESSGWKVPEGALVAQSKLESAENVRNIPMLRITETVSLKDGAPPGIPSTIQVLHGDLHWKNDTQVPVDVGMIAYMRDMSHDAVLRVEALGTHVQSEIKLHTELKEYVLPEKK